MPRTYKAVLRGDRVEWIGAAPIETRAIPLRITLLRDVATPRQGDGGQRAKRGQAMAEALKDLAEIGAFAELSDPASWQPGIRHDRALPGRET